jgi:hypothetical protein
LLSNRELQAVSSCQGLFSAQQWALYWSVLLDRRVTSEEVLDALRRLTPRVSEPDGTYGSIERSTEPWRWWRQKL